MDSTSINYFLFLFSSPSSSLPKQIIEIIAVLCLLA